MADLGDFLNDARSAATLGLLSGVVGGVVARDWIQNEGGRARHIAGVGVFGREPPFRVGVGADWPELGHPATTTGLAALLRELGAPIGADILDGVQVVQVRPPEATFAPGDPVAGNVARGTIGCSVVDPSGTFWLALTAGHLGLDRWTPVLVGGGRPARAVRVCTPTGSPSYGKLKCGGFSGGADVAALTGAPKPRGVPIARRPPATWPSRIDSAIASPPGGVVIGVFDWLQSAGGAHVWGCTWSATRSSLGPLGLKGKSGMVVFDGAGHLLGHQVASDGTHGFIQDIDFQLDALGLSDWVPVHS